MNEERLTLLLLPGMDGTGELFANFVKELPDWIESRVVSYPMDRELSYDQLLAIVKSVLSTGRPFVILAESFSTPLAVRFASESPGGLMGLVLCAGFVSPPRRDLLTRVVLLVAPVLFLFKLPKSVCRYFLVGAAASKDLISGVCGTLTQVSAGVLASRLRSVLSCDSVQALRSVSVPLLYLAGSRDRPGAQIIMG